MKLLLERLHTRRRPLITTNAEYFLTQLEPLLIPALHKDNLNCHIKLATQIPWTNTEKLKL